MMKEAASALRLNILSSKSSKVAGLQCCNNAGNQQRRNGWPSSGTPNISWHS